MAKKLTPDEQLQEAYNIIIENIQGGLTHQHYKKVTELATLYQQLITGEDTDSLLRQFTRREDDTLFAQRKALTSLITPAVSAMIMNPFYRVGRTNNINSKIDFKSTEGYDEKLKRVKEVVKNYNGSNTLNDYLDVRLVDLNFSDPNAFIVTEFDDVPRGAQGEMLELPSPRPVEISSKEAINYSYKNNVLQWLLVRKPITYYNSKDAKCEGYKYTIYFPDIAIEFEQVDLTGESIRKNELIEYEVEGGTVKYFRTDDTTLFEVEEYQYNAGQVPAVRVGYQLDKSTHGKTMVSPMHNALCYFMKSIKTVSEFDLTMALHAFPQKFQYVNKCQGVKDLGCNKGQTTDGGTCSACKGTGISIHTSAQDAVVMRIPNDKDDMINLESMVHYEYPPIDLLTFQNEFIYELKNEAKQAVFNSEIFVKATASKTATEIEYSYEAVYDTLFPYAKNYSNVYQKIVEVSASFVDVTDTIVYYKFPKDFKFKTVDDLLNELKLANDSSAPGYIKQELSNDISSQQYVDKPDELKRIVAKQQFYPFPDKNFAEISFIISSDLTSKYNKVLYANFDNIFLQLERAAESKGQYFYDYAPELQKKLLDEAVNALILVMDGQNTLAIDMKSVAGEEIVGGVIDPTVTDIEAEAKAKLKGTVGGVQGILAIQDSVARGTTSIESAKTLLFEIYGFEDSVATKLLGKPKAIKPANDFKPNSATA